MSISYVDRITHLKILQRLYVAYDCMQTTLYKATAVLVSESNDNLFCIIFGQHRKSFKMKKMCLIRHAGTKNVRNVYPNRNAIIFTIRQLFLRITFLNICENWKIRIYSIQLHMLWNSKAFILPSNSYQKGAITRKSKTTVY